MIFDRHQFTVNLTQKNLNTNSNVVVNALYFCSLTRRIRGAQ